MEKPLPSIPAKRYFTIGEVSELCGVKPYVLRYWEQEFAQLKPMKRRGNRRYYQHHEVLLIRRIRDLLYEQGFTISGARNRLTESAQPQVTTEHELLDPGSAAVVDAVVDAGADAAGPDPLAEDPGAAFPNTDPSAQPEAIGITLSMPQMRQELLSIRELLAV